MSARRLRYFLAACLLLVVASCFGRRAPTIEPTETSPGAAAAAPTGNTEMPATLRMAFLRAQQKAAGYDFQSDGAGTLRGRAGADVATAAVAATARGVRLSRDDDGGLELGVETTSVGREGAAHSRAVLGRRAEGQELVLDREDDVEERYLAGPLGLEQSWVLRERPAGSGPLAIEVAFDGLAPEVTGGRVLLRDDAGLVRAGYGDLVAADAEGRELPARMAAREGGVALVIDDAGATYPVRVDPVVWTQQAELTASDGVVNDLFGSSVSVSGGTALVGAPEHQVGESFDQGAAYVFVQSGATWVQQAELTAIDGAANDAFGVSVSVSGGTALVGAGNHKVGANPLQGAAYVFVQSGTTWVQQVELNAGDGAAEDGFGYSVSVSGGTALVGAAAHKIGANPLQGAAYVFVQSGTTWTQEARLTAIDGTANDRFGFSVSVNGGTALVGAITHTEFEASSPKGAAYVFVQSGTTWTQEAELTASDGAMGDSFGWSVSVSEGTALVGARLHQVGANLGQGAAYVFAQSGTTWMQQAELTASDGAANDWFGYSVSVRSGTAFVGAPGLVGSGPGPDKGAVYVFARSGTTWIQEAKLTASDGAAGDDFGASVSVSEGTALVAAAIHQVGANVQQGAAYVFVPGSTTGPGSSSSSGTGGGGGGEWIPLYGRACSFVAGEPTPDERSLLVAVAALAVIVGLRRRRRRAAREQVARRLRYVLTACLLLVVASSLDGRSPRIEPAETRPTAGDTAMPATLRMAFLHTQQKAAGYDFQRDAAGTLRGRAGAQGATAAVSATARGVRLSRDDEGGLALGVETRSVGRDGAAYSRAVLGRRAEGQELVLDGDDGVEERYLAGPLGLEQSWLIRERPAGSGSLAIEVAFDGLAPEVTGDRVLLRDEAGLVRAGYGDLVAADADGRELSARMEAR
jgi:MYXO-CTERM domain-containing protein